MNTTNRYIIPTLRPSRHRDYVVILDDLEFIFSKNQLDSIAHFYNEGEWVADIAKKIKRNEYEVLMAIVHLHIKRKLTRDLAYRRKRK